jgi:cyanate lyase
MTRAQLSETILDIKRENRWSWKHVREQIRGMSPVLITGALLGQVKLTTRSPDRPPTSWSTGTVCWE